MSTAFTVGMTVRVIERVDSRYGQIGTVILVSETHQTASVRFADGDEQAYLLDENEIEEVEEVA